jgi:uncharacterized membrane protein HdeD (DUF308 family)
MTHVEISGLIAGIISIFVGILVIAWPRIIAYVIGVYLIIVGIIAVVAALR